MLVKTLEANNNYTLANKCAGWIRIGYKLETVVYTDEKNPYKAFLVKYDKNFNEKYEENLDIDEKILYNIKCKNVEKYKDKLEKILYGNTNKPILINNKILLFDDIIFKKDNIVLINSYLNGRLIKLNEKYLEKIICNLIKEFNG